MLESAAQVLTDEFLPLNRAGDQQGLRWDPETGAVTTPDGFRQAFDNLRASGLVGLTAPVEYEGLGGPETLGAFLSELSTATNKSLSMCMGLTHGLIDALKAHASDELKGQFLSKLVTGEWTGTMCLTEPQCGTDLGLITTKATPEGDHFRLTGTKIWITFGEHDLADNIIHLVLARLPDAPPGIKGISAFLVPKINLDGSANNVMCTGLEHKMGINASPTCVIQMEDSIGYLVGVPHKGMRSMFTMMNLARLQVGVEGIGLGDIAYQTALAFAKDRRQSRSLNPERQDESATADNILVHPDVRRMLLNIKSTNEGMRGLAAWIGIEHDVSHGHADEAVRAEASDLVALLTPIVKSYCSERGFLNTSEAMQVCGGAGYTTDWNIEQYLRDVRIAMIYEGTNHIQALDLVGRKLPMGNGRLIQLFSKRVTELIRSSAGVDGMDAYVTPLKGISKTLSKVTMELAGRGMEDREVVGAVASNYLNLFALTSLAYVWTLQAKHVLETKDTTPFAKTKLKTASYFMERVLPEYHSLVAVIEAGKSNMMDFDVDEF